MTEAPAETQPKRRAPGLLHLTAAPEHLRFNAFVHHGYRMPMSVWECVSSVFTLHNETFNVLTHGGAWLVRPVLWRRPLLPRTPAFRRS